MRAAAGDDVLRARREEAHDRDDEEQRRPGDRTIGLIWSRVASLSSGCMAPLIRFESRVCPAMWLGVLVVLIGIGSYTGAT
jgi:hypothetical protein